MAGRGDRGDHRVRGPDQVGRGEFELKAPADLVWAADAVIASIAAPG